MEDVMNIGEARGIYSSLIKSYNIEKFKLAQQRDALKEKMKGSEYAREQCEEQAVILELKYNAVKEKQDEYQKYMNGIMEKWSAQFSKVASEQQADAVEEYASDVGKIMEVARRIMHGDIVPASDEKKLMEFDSDLYQMAKNAGEMAKQMEKERYKHKSLWEEKEKEECVDPMESADSVELEGAAPEVVNVEETIEGALI